MTAILTLSHLNPNPPLDIPINEMECFQLEGKDDEYSPSLIIKTGDKTVFLSYSYEGPSYVLGGCDKVRPISLLLAKFDKLIPLPKNTFGYERMNLFAATSALSEKGELTNFDHVYLKKEGYFFYWLSGEKAGERCLFPRGIPELSPVEIVLKTV